MSCPSRVDGQPRPLPPTARWPRAVAAALVLCSSGAAAQETADSVSLRFGWRDGMTAQVEQELTKVRTTGQRSDSSALRATSTLRVTAHPRGFLVQSESLAVQGLPAATGSEAEFAQRLFAMLGSLTPSYLVNAEGEFIELTDLARLKAAVDTLFEPMLAKLSDEMPQARAFLRQAISEEVMTASAAQDWNAMVGTWVGADWEIGAWYELESEEPIPALPGLTIPMLMQFSAAERVPCTADDSAASCVSLQMITRPDSAGMKRLMTQIFERMGGIAEAREIIAAMEGMEVENELTVIAEPATMIPHVVVREKRTRVVVKASGKEAGGETSQIERNVQRYRYPSFPRRGT